MRTLQQFGENLWIVDGANVRDMGISFTTRMTIAKLSDGSLWVESPVSVPYETLKQIVELGPVRYIVSSTQRHVWRLEEWHKLFPEAQLWVPPTTLFTFKNKVLSYTGILIDDPYQGWANDFEQLTFKGSHWFKEVIFYHKESRTVIMGDLIQIHSVVKGKPFLNAFMKFEGVKHPDGGVGFDIRLTFTKRNLARQSLERLLSWDFNKLIIAHGGCIGKDAKQFVEKAFQWLKR